jgi:hypothetical protein
MTTADLSDTCYLNSDILPLIFLLTTLPNSPKIQLFLDLTGRGVNESVKIALKNLELIEGLL